VDALLCRKVVAAVGEQVVLIGAQMPSVLAEMSFVTNKQDAALLKTAAYRQKIAEALFEAIVQYQQSLKKKRTSS